MARTNRALVALGAAALGGACGLWKLARDAARAKVKSNTGSRVVIVGGGFAGLYAAKALADAPVQVTLIDKNNFHLFQPMLYQVATGELPADDIAAPLRAVLAKQPNTEVRMAEVTGVDVAAREVEMAGRRVPYDVLVLATGSHYDYFGHPEWQQHAPSLKTVEDAITIRAKILQAFEASEEETDSEKIKQLLTIVLIGAGPTGVELAGAISGLVRRTLAHEFRRIDPTQARIILVEATDHIMGSYPLDIAKPTQKQLDRLGVEVKLNAKVEAIDADGVTAGGKRIASRTVLWTAGTVGTDAGKWIGVETGKKGQVKVQPDLTVPGHPEIFVIGDVAAVKAPSRNIFGILEPKPKTMPGVAPPAIQEGEYVGRVICARAEGRPAPPPFLYWDKGTLAQVSRGFSAADLGVVQLTGFFAWLLWLSIHIFYLIGFGNRLLVLMQWAVTALTAQRGGRLFPQGLAADVPKPSTERSGADAAV
ncbi:MAG: NAD(P)/FAD-dependent oxidoreductase [Armatimonadota bacterium]|nr:NAD(P)/FAD-dependent oxidoreductase [Armatimonadota bacterium]